MKLPIFLWWVANFIVALVLFFASGLALGGFQTTVFVVLTIGWIASFGVSLVHLFIYMFVVMPDVNDKAKEIAEKMAQEL